MRNQRKIAERLPRSRPKLKKPYDGLLGAIIVALPELSGNVRHRYDYIGSPHPQAVHQFVNDGGILEPLPKQDGAFCLFLTRSRNIHSGQVCDNPTSGRCAHRGERVLMHQSDLVKSVKAYSLCGRVMRGRRRGKGRRR